MNRAEVLKKAPKLCKPVCVLAATAIMGSGLATINSGHWDLTSGLADGGWLETFANGPGSVGSTIWAHAYWGFDGPQWWLHSFALVSTTPAGDGWYDTVYTGGALQLTKGPWGDGGVVTDMTAFNHSYFYFDDDNLAHLRFTFKATGTYNGKSVLVDAVFVGDSGINYSFEPSWHMGERFQALSLTVPDEGTTLVLIGVALSTIGYLRRKGGA